MSHQDDLTSTEVLIEVRRELLALAKREDDSAAAEAGAVPYWSPVPSSVDGHRAAARTLRRAAATVEARVRTRGRARTTGSAELAQAS